MNRKFQVLGKDFTITEARKVLRSSSALIIAALTIQILKAMTQYFEELGERPLALAALQNFTN